MTKSRISASLIADLFIAGPMRSHYGPILNCEPTITFRPDGSGCVSGGGKIIELSIEEIDSWRD